MVLFNYSTKEITAKIVYYGPGLCGKTTNLQFIYDDLPETINKGKMLSLATKTDRTLFFDFLPIDLGMIRGMRTRLQLYTVPGQVFYNTTRKLVLKGADGVVFVADSQNCMLEANIESLKNLEENLAEHDMVLEKMPLILQFNKRDLPDVAAVEELNAALNINNVPIYEAVATTGVGVHETLKAITRLVLNSLKERYTDQRHHRPVAVSPAQAAANLNEGTGGRSAASMGTTAVQRPGRPDRATQTAYPEPSPARTVQLRAPVPPADAPAEAIDEARSARASESMRIEPFDLPEIPSPDFAVPGGPREAPADLFPQAGGDPFSAPGAAGEAPADMAAIAEDDLLAAPGSPREAPAGLFPRGGDPFSAPGAAGEAPPDMAVIAEDDIFAMPDITQDRLGSPGRSLPETEPAEPESLRDKWLFSDFVDLDSPRYPSGESADALLEAGVEAGAPHPDTMDSLPVLELIEEPLLSVVPDDEDPSWGPKDRVAKTGDEDRTTGEAVIRKPRPDMTSPGQAFEEENEDVPAPPQRDDPSEEPCGSSPVSPEVAMGASPQSPLGLSVSPIPADQIVLPVELSVGGRALRLELKISLAPAKDDETAERVGRIRSNGDDPRM